MTEPDNAPRPVRPPTPVWVPRAALWFVSAFAGLVAACWLLFQLRSLVSLLAIALFASFALEPAVAALNRRGMRRGVAAGLVMLTCALILLALAGSIGAVAVSQGATLADDLPGIANDLATFTNEQASTQLNPTEISDKVAAWVDNFSVDAIAAGTTALGVFGQLLSITFFAFYFAADGPRLRRMVVSLVRPDHQSAVLRVFELAIAKTGGYMYSRGLMALMSAAAHAVAFYAMGVRYPIPLALWIGVMSQVVPVIGTYIGAAVPVLVALNASPGTAIAVVIFIVVYQQVENGVIFPRVTRKSVDIHPAVAFAAVLGGAALAGPTGGLLAIPVVATASAFVAAYVNRHELANADHDLLALGPHRSGVRIGARIRRARDHHRVEHHDADPRTG